MCAYRSQAPLACYLTVARRPSLVCNSTPLSSEHLTSKVPAGDRDREHDMNEKLVGFFFSPSEKLTLAR